MAVLNTYCSNKENKNVKKYIRGNNHFISYARLEAETGNY